LSLPIKVAEQSQKKESQKTSPKTSSSDSEGKQQKQQVSSRGSGAYRYPVDATREQRLQLVSESPPQSIELFEPDMHGAPLQRSTSPNSSAHSQLQQQVMQQPSSPNGTPVSTVSSSLASRSPTPPSNSSSSSCGGCKQAKMDANPRKSPPSI